MFITSFGEQNITYKCCSNFLIHLSFPQLNQALTVGTGIRWQSDIYTYVKRTNSFKSEQGSYGIFDLMARYKINENLTANLNINNLFNEKYHLTTLNSYYGAPTNVQVGVKYNW